MMLLALGGPATAAPPMMTALHKKGLSCFTPFRCISTRQVPTPTPGEGQALVKVAASSVNPCDVDYIELGFGCKGAAGTLGMDLAGTVVGFQDPQSHRGLGACARLQVGDAVWADGPKTGAMAEYAVVSCEQAGLKPKTLNLTEAGTIPLVGFTALEMWLKTGAPFTAPNLTAVVTSGTGGTGFMAIQLAKALGIARVVTSTSGAADIALAKALGADVVIDYEKQDIFATLSADSVDVVFDNYGAKGSADKAMRALRAGGTYIILPGGEGGTVSKHPKAGVRQINFGFTTSSNHTHLDTLAELFDAGKLKAHIYAQVPLQEGARAFAISKTGEVAGKVAVVVSS